MDTEATRSLAQRFIAARAAADVDGIAATLAPDAVWQPPLSAAIGPFNGRDAVSKALGGGVQATLFDVSTIRRDVRKLVVEGDTAVFQQRLSATTLAGKEYVNEYCWVLTCTDAGIVRLDEYADTLHGARVFGTVG